MTAEHRAKGDQPGESDDEQRDHDGARR